MTGDGGVADGVSQGERWDSNYKRQEESCWLAHKNLSKQSWEARVSPESAMGEEDFCQQAPSAAARAPPALQGGTDVSVTPSSAEQPWVPVLQALLCFLPLCLVHRASQTPSCPSQLPNKAKTSLWFSCGTSCARRDGLGASLPRPAEGRKSRAELTACKRFLSFFCPAVILRLIAPLPRALIFLLYHDSRFPSEKFPASQRGSGGV